LSKYKKYGGKVLDYFSMLSAEHGDILILPYSGGWYDQPLYSIRELKLVQSEYKRWLNAMAEKHKKESKSGNSTGVSSNSRTFAEMIEDNKNQDV